MLQLGCRRWLLSPGSVARALLGGVPKRDSAKRSLQTPETSAHSAYASAHARGNEIMSYTHNMYTQCFSVFHDYCCYMHKRMFVHIDSRCIHVYKDINM